MEIMVSGDTPPNDTTWVLNLHQFAEATIHVRSSLLPFSQRMQRRPLVSLSTTSMASKECGVSLPPKQVRAEAENTASSPRQLRTRGDQQTARTAEKSFV